MTSAVVAVSPAVNQNPEACDLVLHQVINDAGGISIRDSGYTMTSQAEIDSDVDPEQYQPWHRHCAAEVIGERVLRLAREHGEVQRINGQWLTGATVVTRST